MSSPFQTEQMTLGQLFSGDLVFSFPAFQRPYRWTEDEALTLIDDIAAACLRNDPGYFIGNLVTTRHDDRLVMVIDGRQRLTTLFMLIAILRDLEPDESRKRELHKLIWDAPDPEKGRHGNWRLTFSEAEQALIDSRLSALEGGDSADTAGSEVSTRYLAMFEVADRMRELLQKPASETGMPRLTDFTDYLLQHCEVIVLTASSATSGLRLFQVLNNRGLQLSEADLIKPDLLAGLSVDAQGKAALVWDKLEDELGPEKLDTLLRCYIFIQSGEWVPAGRNLAASLKATMMSRGADAFHFQDLPRYGAAFQELELGDIPYDDDDTNPNHIIQALSYLGRSDNDWREYLPVALEILVRFDGEYSEIYRHICALERNFFIWFMSEVGDAPRRQMAHHLVRQLRDGEDLFADDMGFDVPDLVLAKTINALQSPFPKTFQRLALTRRIELLLCEKAGVAAPQYLELSTVERILPKLPSTGSQWMSDFTRADHRECLDLLGNCMPLTRELDQRVGNRDFRAKKAIFRDTGIASYFRSAADACNYPRWTPDVIKERTARLTGLLADHWRSIPREPAEDEFDWDDEEDDAPA